MSETRRRLWQEPGRREAMSELLRQFWADPRNAEKRRQQSLFARLKRRNSIAPQITQMRRPAKKEQLYESAAKLELIACDLSGNEYGTIMGVVASLRRKADEKL